MSSTPLRYRRVLKRKCGITLKNSFLISAYFQKSRQKTIYSYWNLFRSHTDSECQTNGLAASNKSRERKRWLPIHSAWNVYRKEKKLVKAKWVWIRVAGKCLPVVNVASKSHLGMKYAAENRWNKLLLFSIYTNLEFFKMCESMTAVSKRGNTHCQCYFQFSHAAQLFNIRIEYVGNTNCYCWWWGMVELLPSPKICIDRWQCQRFLNQFLLLPKYQYQYQWIISKQNNALFNVTAKAYRSRRVIHKHGTWF